MKRKTSVRIIAIVIAVVLALSLLLLPIAAYGAEPTVEEDGVTVLFTHDLHDHLLPVNQTDAEGSTASTGGFARLKTVMDAVRADHSITLTVDAGDFSMGSLFQTIFQSDAPELRMLGALGVDVTTFGNHEYDYGPAALGDMLHAALESGDTLPQIVQANYSGDSEDAAALQRAMDDYGAAPYTIIERGGVKIGVFGLMGEDADQCAPNSQMTLADPTESAETAVAELTAQGAELIICLSHSGTSEDEKTSEDVQLAKAVPEIDLIVSGHTHTVLSEPLQVGDTYIVSCGAYCANLGEITLLPDGDGWTLGSYALHPIDGSVAEDADTTARIADFKTIVQEKYLDTYDLTFDQVLAKNDVLFPTVETLDASQEEAGFGNLLADSYRYAIAQSEGTDYEEIALTVVPQGVIRATLPLGEITVSDVFNVLPLGAGADGTMGYPLVSVYLTGKELEDVAEIDASVSSMMPYAKLHVSGIRYTYNPNRAPLDYVTDLQLVHEDGQAVWAGGDTLYRVVTDLYSAQMLASVKDAAYGFLKITPKDAQGNEITDWNSAIIHDQSGNEIKAWQCVATYLASFNAGEDGISVIPAAYAQADGRKILNDDNSIGAILSNPGTTTMLFIGALILGVALIMLVAQIAIRRWNKTTQYERLDQM